MARHELRFRPSGSGQRLNRTARSLSIKRRQWLRLAGLSIFTFYQAPALAQLTVEVNRGSVQPIDIALTRFVSDVNTDPAFAQNIVNIITSDLESSGLFRPVNEQAFIQSPEDMVPVPRFADWRQINAQALMTGSVQTLSNGTLVAEFRLWDVVAGQQLEGIRYETQTGLWRRVSHQISDAIYTRMTGDAGYFDTKVAYIAETGPRIQRIKRLAIMDLDGANHRFLTDGSQLVLTPRIDPSGTKIAYLVYGTGQPQVRVYDLNTNQTGLLGQFQGMTFSPRFAPSNDEMLLTLAENGNSDIYGFSTVNRQTRRLTSDGAIDTSPTYSPDGQMIAFNSDRGGSPQIYVMDRAGTNQRRISFGRGQYGSPAWSPRGDLIAFTNIKEGYFHIGVMAPDGSNERLLTRSYQDESPSWSPNGRVIMFSREERDKSRSRLFTIDITGYNLREVQTPQDASDGDWSPLVS